LAAKFGLNGCDAIYDFYLSLVVWLFEHFAIGIQAYMIRDGAPDSQRWYNIIHDLCVWGPFYQI